MDYMFKNWWNTMSFDQDLSSWNISKVESMTGMFEDVTLSTSNYDAILDAWSQLILKNNVSFNAGNSKYCNSESQRESIINNYSWNITDAGKECS